MIGTVSKTVMALVAIVGSNPTLSADNCSLFMQRAFVIIVDDFHLLDFVGLKNALMLVIIAIRKNHMQGFFTLLPRPYFEQVKLLWDGLEDRFGLNFIRVTPIPHFSWQIGEGYQIESVLPQLSQLTKSMPAYEVHVCGVEVFYGDQPVVYLQVMRTAHIRAMHRKFWSVLTPYTDQPNLLYAPGRWQPHVTLALNDLTSEVLPDVVQWLKEFKIDWTFTCHDFTLVGQYENGLTCLEASFECGQGLVATDGCTS